MVLRRGKAIDGTRRDGDDAAAAAALPSGLPAEYPALQQVPLPWKLEDIVATATLVGGVFALSIVFGAYASETFRGGFVAVPQGQLEAARAFGMPRVRVFSRIHLPQAWRYALPGLSNLWQTLLKDTSLVSVLGLEQRLEPPQRPERECLVVGLHLGHRLGLGDVFQERQLAPLDLVHDAPLPAPPPWGSTPRSATLSRRRR